MSLFLPQLKDRDRVLLVEAGRLHPAISFSRASAATCFNSSGALSSVSSNKPRWEYNSNGSYQGLLVEEQRTNLLLQSDSTIANIAPKSGVTDASSALASYFTKSVQFPQSSGTSNFAYKLASITNGVVYTLSVFVRMDNNSAPVPSGSSTSGDFALVMQNNVVYSFTTTYVGNSVYRVSATVTATATGTYNFGVVQYNTQTQKAFRVTGYQLEAGAFPTSYIATTTASVTRSADIMSVSGASIRYNANNGTLYGYADSLGFQFSAGLMGGGSLARLLCVDSVGVIQIYNGNSVNLGTLTANTMFKFCTSYNATTLGGSMNGATGSTAATSTAFTASTLYIGAYATGGTVWNGHIQRLVYEPTTRLVTDLKRLST